MAAKKRARAASKRTGSKKGKVKPVSLPDASEQQRATIFRALTRTLAEHGVRGEITELHLEVAGQVLEAVPCPQGSVRRMVCSRRPDNTLVCQDRCVPV